MASQQRHLQDAMEFNAWVSSPVSSLAHLDEVFWMVFWGAILHHQPPAAWGGWLFFEAGGCIKVIAISHWERLMVEMKHLQCIQTLHIEYSDMLLIAHRVSAIRIYQDGIACRLIYWGRHSLLTTAGARGNQIRLEFLPPSKHGSNIFIPPLLACFNRFYRTISTHATLVFYGLWLYDLLWSCLDLCIQHSRLFDSSCLWGLDFSLHWDIFTACPRFWLHGHNFLFTVLTATGLCFIRLWVLIWNFCLWLFLRTCRLSQMFDTQLR